MLTSYYLPYLAGAELYVKEMAESLANDKHNVTIITKHFGNLKNFEVINKVNIHRVKTLDLPQSRSLISLPSLFFKTLKLSKDASLIHAHITYPNGIIAYLVHKITKIPYIITLQGDELFDYPEKKLLKLLKFPIKLALKNSSKIHCISNALSTSIQKNFNISKEKITIIPNGVNINQFKNAKKINLHKKYSSKSILISVSRLTIKNNLSLVIESLKNMQDIKFIIIGSGPEEEKLKKLAKKLNVNATFLGYIENKKIPFYLKDADIFIRTPTTEGLGIVFLEAMAANVPIIASKVAGIPDIIKHNYNGILVNLDKKEIRNAINLLLKSQLLRKKLTKNASKFVKDYDWPIIYKKTFNLYQTVLKHH